MDSITTVWYFRFNNGQEHYTRDPEEAADIRRHLAANEYEEELCRCPVISEGGY